MRIVKGVAKYILKVIVVGIFNCFKILPINNNRVLLDSWKGQTLKGSIQSIYEELITINDLEIILVGNNKKLSSNKVKVVSFKSIKYIYYLATSKYWIVDTLYYDFFKPRKETKYILIWHAAGMFKKFGISSVESSKRLVEIYKRNGKNLTNLVISSENIKEIYSKELCVSKEKVLCLGLPRTDEFLKNENNEKEKIYLKYNIERSKKIILYAPTFRGEGITEFNIDLNLNMLMEKLGSDYTIIIKLHPNNYLESNKLEVLKDIIISKEDNLEELMKASDILITDYSSIIFEYCLLERPIFFYGYDLEKYIKDERGFYFNYYEFVPGPISFSTEELIKQMEEYSINNYIEKIRYVKDNYQIHDSKCTERFIKYFFNNI